MHHRNTVRSTSRAANQLKNNDMKAIARTQKDEYPIDDGVKDIVFGKGGYNITRIRPSNAPMDY